MNTLAFKNGDQMPALGLGTWKSEPGKVKMAVYEAIKAGYRHIDCAPIYGNEPEVGEGIKQAIEEGIISRKELWITSKLWNDSHKQEDVIPSLKKSLLDLQLTYLDLYLIHWPVVLKKGTKYPSSADDFLSTNSVPLTETWQGMEKAQREGLANHIGVSNFNIDKIKNIINDCKINPELNQVEMHPFLPQQELCDYCMTHRINVTAYSPLGSGDRPDKMKQDNEPILMDNEVINSIAANHKHTPAQILIAWALHRGTAVIPKSTNKERIRQNYEASFIKLTQADMNEIDQLDYEYRFVTGEAWEMEGNSYVAKKFWD
ncbi:aldo/keto reductase [Fulvivirga sediminis]|uniref:Aldo/keto reductase n=1 Tax=Fulvivirga sediminis TaxID=2803949 RepID=A0A937K2Y1_9BACT|nr:aldo/keto reductase [Fulvivirga sediminis]MBL3658347.1 aldo/keto reductase [Fulvivirga sediminis]